MVKNLARSPGWSLGGVRHAGDLEAQLSWEELVSGGKSKELKICSGQFVWPLFKRWTACKLRRTSHGHDSNSDTFDVVCCLSLMIMDKVSMFAIS